MPKAPQDFTLGHVGFLFRHSAETGHTFSLHVLNDRGVLEGKRLFSGLVDAKHMAAELRAMATYLEGQLT